MTNNYDPELVGRRGQAFGIPNSERIGPESGLRCTTTFKTDNTAKIIWAKHQGSNCAGKMGKYSRIMRSTMVARRIALIFLCLIISACVRQPPRYYCVPQVYTIQMLQQTYGTPNQIISRRSYTWYGYVTRSPYGYPVKLNYSRYYPKTPDCKTCSRDTCDTLQQFCQDRLCSLV